LNRPQKKFLPSRKHAEQFWGGDCFWAEKTLQNKRLETKSSHQRSLMAAPRDRVDYPGSLGTPPAAIPHATVGKTGAGRCRGHQPGQSVDHQGFRHPPRRQKLDHRPQVVTLDPDGKVPRTRVELLLNDLYPRSDTSFMIYKGAAVNAGTGILVKSFPMDRDAAESTVIRVDELDSKLTEDGTSTLALMSDTVFGTEFLCPPVTFRVKRSLQVNAMQVSYSDSNQP
jgi:hypothetical protein